MAHFVMDTENYQVHLYCRHQEDFEDFLRARDADFGVHDAADHELSDGTHHDERLHIYSRSGELYAVNLDATSCDEEGAVLPQEVLDGLEAAFPLWHLPKPGTKMPPAPFSVEMLEALKDY